MWFFYSVNAISKVRIHRKYVHICTYKTSFAITTWREQFVLNSFGQCNIEGSDCPKVPYIILPTKRLCQLQIGVCTICIKHFRSMQYWRFGLSESPYINILTKRTIFITVNHLLPFLIIILITLCSRRCLSIPMIFNFLTSNFAMLYHFL